MRLLTHEKYSRWDKSLIFLHGMMLMVYSFSNAVMMLMLLNVSPMWFYEIRMNRDFRFFFRAFMTSAWLPVLGLHGRDSRIFLSCLWTTLSPAALGPWRARLTREVLLQ
jgi:hypothetical protein